jgi:hypothetical protein
MGARYTFIQPLELDARDPWTWLVGGVRVLVTTLLLGALALPLLVGGEMLAQFLSATPALALVFLGLVASPLVAALVEHMIRSAN